jgi:hypothetical protein
MPAAAVRGLFFELSICFYKKFNSACGRRRRRPARPNLGNFAPPARFASVTTGLTIVQAEFRAMARIQHSLKIKARTDG